MYAREIVTEGLKPLDNGDTGESAILRMHEYNVNQLPVTEAGRYIGIINMEDVVALAHLNNPIKELPVPLKRPYVFETAHLFEVIKTAVQYNVKVVPVLGKDEKYIGLITAESSMRAFAALQSLMEDGSMITLSVPLKDYRLSEIARIAEDNNVKILSLCSQINPSGPAIEITLKLNSQELSPLIAAYERYDYEVQGVYQADSYNEDMKDRYDALMRYLDI